jgi:rod shape-determining protein MreC
MENVLHYVLDPLQRVFSNTIENTGDLFQTVRQVRELRAEIEELRSQVDALTAENVRLREYEAEVQQLRALLNFASEYPVSTPLGADVIGQEACEIFPCGEIVGVDPNPYLRYVTINVGSQQGADIGMPVVSGAALVGRVAQVGPRTSKVQLLTDPDSQIGALLQGSRVTGLVAGQPDGSLRMVYIPQEETVSPGENVLTSGLGGFLPKGLVIGQVTEDLFQMDSELFQAATVRPAVDFARLEQVLVITAFEQIPIEEAPPGG